ncbi:hypothetical protein BXT86_01670 [candidate division WOR-3 bacterium 4484_100]|uniref:Transposase IS200-like domain-containing protein n=1 Tax=candidate division WOR-3 bacterium 4484_100 TaxID=1936077 RepID=A0A1V4QG71_UNCW3|nr:MAG: hypothetical protein BXT86_01670 [candidate division WOR-3 bacterium 4484_100]
MELIRQGKVKRYFRARHKLSFPGAISHITQRAPGKEMLFIDASDYLFMIHLIKESAKRYNLRFYSFALMPNHLHLLLQTEKNNLSNALKRTFNSYAFYFNRKYERKGHVFCGRFRQALCFDDTYFLASSIYIHMNPVVAGLSKSVAGYRWSSIKPFIQNFNRKTFINYKFVLKILDQDLNIAREKYKELVKRSLEIKLKNSLEHADALTQFRDKFINLLKQIIAPEEELKSVFTFDSEIDALVKTKYYKNPKTLAEKKYLIEQLLANGYKVSEIAKKLGVTRQAIYYMLKQKT